MIHTRNIAPHDCTVVLPVDCLDHHIFEDIHASKSVSIKRPPMNTMTSSHQSFLIVPGAWHQPEMYEKLVTLLQEAGYSALVGSLPSCDAQDPQDVTCSKDAEAVREHLIRSMETDGKDVVVVCHSYGGIPGAGAAHGLSKIARAKGEKKGSVIGLIYVSGFVVPEKSSLLDIMGGKHAPYVGADQVPVPVNDSLNARCRKTD